MKTRCLIACLLVLLTTTLGMAQNGEKPDVIWNELVKGYDNTFSTLRVKEVRMYADRTELSVHVDYPSGKWIRVQKDLYLQADGKKYPLKAATVITIGKEFWMPESGAVDFDLTFEPLPTDCKRIDFIEPDGWTIMNIRSADFQPEGIDDTYWRDEATGGWFIGFTPECIIYDCRFWDITSSKSKKDTYQLTAINGEKTIDIKVSKMKKGLRTIAINGGKAVKCSPITTEALPDYPTKDLRTGFKDNGYRMGDSVTFIGWLKDMPESEWKKGSEFEIHYENIITSKEENAYAKMDSLGRFAIKMPLMNTTEVFIDWGRSTINSFIEPGETYLLLSDYSLGKTLFMGTDVRVQNELLAHPKARSGARLRLGGREGDEKDAMDFMERAIRERNEQMEDLQKRIERYPNLSQRYIDYLTGYYLTSQGESMMQAKFEMKNMELPQAYMDYVQREIWTKSVKPYTLYRDFTTFKIDYLDQLNAPSRSFQMDKIIAQIFRLEETGEVSLTDEEREAMKQYPIVLEQTRKKIETASDEEKKALASEFNKSAMTRTVNMILSRHTDAIYEERIRSSIRLVDSVGCDRTLRDLHLAYELYRRIDNGRKPLGASMIKWMEKEIELPVAKAMVNDVQAKYLAIQKRDISNSASLKKTSEEMRNMSDGEQLLRKLIEPYKGRIILLDVWGTWCGPCKAALAKSQEEYERLKPYNMVFLYLANRSSDEAWKNVIKEYNVLGDNVVHYNLPTEQQDAIEKFLKVNAFPTYKLIDENGNILDVNADPRNLDALVRLIESMHNVGTK